MVTLRKIEEFYPKNTNIDHYLECLEQYFVANEVKAVSSSLHRHRAILISVIGGKYMTFWQTFAHRLLLSSRVMLNLKPF